SPGVREIIPFVRGTTTLNPYAFVMNPEDDWLIPEDLPTLASLLDGLEAGALSRRVESALWYHEAAARHYYVDLRWPLLTTCLETLVKIKDEKPSSGQRAGSTKVFVDRLLAIAELLDRAESIGEAELVEMYARRSWLAHGLAYGRLDEHDK